MVGAMPSPEYGPGDPPEQPRRQEDEPVPYHRTARFAGEQPAGRAYFSAQRAIFDGPPNDLSTYRFQLNHIYHVAVLGEAPPAELDRQLTDILASGEPAALPSDVLRALTDRRNQAITRGPWSEGHYRPGRRL